MHCNVMICSHKHISAATAAIFRVLLLQEHKDLNVVSCVVLTPLQLPIILISVKII